MPCYKSEIDLFHPKEFLPNADQCSLLTYLPKYTLIPSDLSFILFLFF